MNFRVLPISDIGINKNFIWLFTSPITTTSQLSEFNIKIEDVTEKYRCLF